MHAWELRYLTKHVGPLPGLLVLDVGAGDGRWVGALQAEGAWAYGVDQRPRHPLVYEATFPDLSTAPLVPSKFDLLCFRESLYYLPLYETLRWAHRMLTLGGHIYIKSANARSRHRVRQWGPRVHDPDPQTYFYTLEGAGFAVRSERNYPEERWRVWTPLLNQPDRFVLLGSKR